MSNYNIEVNPTLIDPDGTNSLHGGKLGECIHLILEVDDNDKISGNYTYEQLLTAFESDVHICGHVRGSYYDESDDNECVGNWMIYRIDYNTGKHFFTIYANDFDPIYLNHENVYDMYYGVVEPK